MILTGNIFSRTYQDRQILCTRFPKECLALLQEKCLISTNISFQRVLTVVYNILNHPSSRVLKTGKHDVSESASVSVQLSAFRIYLRMETEPVAETLRFLAFRIQEDEQTKKKKQ
jgi:hypothetical protein